MSWPYADSYEYLERVAIRMVDGGLGEIDASQFAILDIKERLAHESKKPQEESRPAAPHRTSDKIERLQQQRDAVGEKMRAEKNLTEKDELYSQWSNLNMQILDLRKELRHDNGRRLSD